MKCVCKKNSNNSFDLYQDIWLLVVYSKYRWRIRCAIAVTSGFLWHDVIVPMKFILESVFEFRYFEDIRCSVSWLTYCFLIFCEAQRSEIKIKYLLFLLIKNKTLIVKFSSESIVNASPILSSFEFTSSGFFFLSFSLKKTHFASKNS